MAGAVDDGWTMVVGQPASEIREEKQIEEWENSKGGWSGFGKHPQNWIGHNRLHLSPEKELGSGSYGLVQRVTYGAVTMARKHVVPRGGMTIEKLREEANAMEELAHKHILKLVGTYTWKRKNLYLLLYPRATCDLGTFLDDIEGIVRTLARIGMMPMKRLYALGLKDIGKIDDLCMLRRPIPHSDCSTHIKRTETALGFLQQLMGYSIELATFDQVIKEKEWPKKYKMLSDHLNKLRNKAIRAALADEEEPNFDAKNILGLVEKMLLYDSEKRPTVKEVNERLCELGGLDQIYHLSCCHKQNDVMSKSINSKMRTISETSLSSKRKISELETENRALKERLISLQSKDQTLRIKNRART
ncbi:hypothetical protein DID88_007915 [Monilinia fructigena]|uniref:Protein kinase domain-containing protein n=1 Tax=Monilinia fructigena TaxID=38457 RepID=A0A395J3S1_9HELO|nr:hypothetical protein DID88_007915 [Monilinia fructigena]